MPINPKKENVFFVFIGLSALLIYAYIIYTHAINMPKWDDFPDILQFMDRWLLADSLAEKISVLLSHTNEHILLVNHIIILTQYYLIGHLDFRWLIFTGNLFFLASAFMLWLPFRNKDESLFAFAVVMLTAISFYCHESTLWAMTALSNQAVIFFSLLTLWYATKTSPSMSKVILLTLLAIFSQSNGFLLLPLVGILFFISHRHKLPVWLAFSTLIILFYTLQLNPASHQEGQTQWTNIPFHHYNMVIPGFIALFGSTFFNDVNIPAFLVSFLLGSTILFLSLKQISAHKRSPFVWYALLFFGLCIASIAFYRGLLAGPSVVFISRYKMYGIYFLVLGLLLSPQWLALYKASPWRRYGILLFCLLFFSISFYLNLPKSSQIDSHLRESLEYWVEDGDFRRGKGYFIKDSDSYLFAALHHDVWSPLALIHPERIIRDIASLDACPDATSVPLDETHSLFQIRHINRNAPGIRVEVSPQNLPDAKEWLIYLCSDSFYYRLHLESPVLYPVYYIPAARIAPGNYQIYVQYDQVFRSTNQYLFRKPHTR